MKKLCRKSGKVKFDSHERALMRVGEILERSKSKIRGAYKCKWCLKYHLTKSV